MRVKTGTAGRSFEPASRLAALPSNAGIELSVEGEAVTISQLPKCVARPGGCAGGSHIWHAVDPTVIAHRPASVLQIVTMAPSERRRVLTCAALGVAVGAVIALIGPWQLSVLVGWDVAAAALVGTIWTSIGRLDADGTRLTATREDDSRIAARAVVTVACVASLIGVFTGIIKARETQGAGGVVMSVASILAVVLAWLAVHTIFTLHYAHRYYDKGGGIEFPDDAAPSYRDFAYVAFTVGMTFQVSDTDISDRAMRWLLLRHAALAYVFGTVIVGLTINLLAGLLG